VQPWMKDLEETLAFAQRRAATKPARIDALTQVEPPKTVALETIKPKDKFFEREEISQRMAEFKATQRKFEREREEYFKKTMAKVRSSSSRNEA
jgi:hypothetical protein